MDAEPVWGVTALQAVQELDAGPIWASRTFAVDPDAPRKSTLYNGPVTDAAVALVHEVVAKATDPGFVPEPLDYTRPGVRGRARPPVRQADRGFYWSDPTEHVLRRIRAADGAPGVVTRLCGTSVAVFDAHRGRVEPGRACRRTRHGRRASPRRRPRAHRRRRDLDRSSALPRRQRPRPQASRDDRPRRPPRRGSRGRGRRGYREISYRRDGPVGILDFRFYNGAMSTGQCRRLLAALRHATAQDTRVLLLRGGLPFSNGIHLGVIDAAAAPAAEAWDNIVAIDDVCEEIITCVDQLVVCSMAGSAGAGGVMLALGADRVVLRAAAVLNPHYRSMGLYGSEYWTYVLPRRVGARTARTLTTDCVPVGAAHAARIGLVDQVFSGEPDAFERVVERQAHRLADRRRLPAARRREARAPRRRRTAQAAAHLPSRGTGRDERRHLRGPTRVRLGPQRLHHEASHPPYRRHHAVKRPHPPCVSA